jgi:hypothetical protein
MVMSPVGPGTKNGCAGEDQQQFTQNLKLKPRMTGLVRASSNLSD